ncbi:MAG: response regulator [Coleofasciculus sp. B1-GNL1-01]|uniref:response regulator n=1 Tax=Coleofasciculus sp. B1-GNL1-01 TaxID=3068484 RepID=UPI00330144E0
MNLTRLIQELNDYSKHGNGELILKNSQAFWTLYLVRGQLLYPKSKHHPVRRWNRAINQHRSNWHWRADYSQFSDNPSWECQLIDRGLSQKQLSLIQAKLIIRSLVQECLFELTPYSDLNRDWKPTQTAISTFCKVVALSSNEIQTILSTTEQMQQQWQVAGLSHLHPTMAPILQEGADISELPIEDKYLNGKLTLWDIAVERNQSIIEVTQSLVDWTKRGMIKFQDIPDLTLPSSNDNGGDTPIVADKKPPEIQQTLPKAKTSLIACIDDSPVLTLTLRKILIPNGYQVLSIPEPMRGFSQLIEHKPDLILLDLLLPNADGYSICKFLRETPVFKKTPIIILTAKNTSIDRTRAQLVGATGFLAKPPQAQELLEMVQKHLG